MIYLGCSGWSYPDWVGTFYPSRETDKLDYYSKRFNTVEINTTFYRIPDIKIFRNWIKKVEGRNFLYSIKFPRDITHRDLLEDLEAALFSAKEFERNYIIPMLEAGELAAILIQLPPYFTQSSSWKLRKLLGHLNTGKVRYFVEPRHSSLLGNEEFRDLVISSGASLTELDGPMATFSSIESRGRSFYLRFHGRKYDKWYEKTDNPSDRYDYEYSEKEISIFGEILRKNLERYEDAFIYFNNHPEGKAPRNAVMLSARIGVKSRDPQSRLM